MKKANAEFALRLRQWRGQRKQLEAADVLRVPLRTYQSWETGLRMPLKVCRGCVLARMQDSQVSI